MIMRTDACCCRRQFFRNLFRKRVVPMNEEGDKRMNELIKRAATDAKAMKELLQSIEPYA